MQGGGIFVMNGQGERLPVYISDKGEIVPKDSLLVGGIRPGYGLLFVLFLARDSETFGEILMDILLPQMAECRHGMVQQHPWSGIPHDFTHPFFHFGLVAVNAALPAGGFILTERTA